MNPEKKDRLEANGWMVGNYDDFLGLDPTEKQLVELQIILSQAVRRVRKEKGLTQAVVAARMGSSQSRMAKIEAASRSVSLDLTIEALVSLGVDRVGIARILLDASSNQDKD